MFVPAYQPLYELLLGFVAEDQFRDAVLKGRGEYVRHTGETFEEDRSYEYRVQAFLDWFIFDRPLEEFGEPPVRAYALAKKLNPDDAERFRIFGRTVHGLFAVERSGEESVGILNLITNARYEVVREKQVAGLNKGDLFEGRLVPWEGRYHFSPAFLFYPAHVRKRVQKELRRQRRTGEFESVQEILFTLSRMAARAEHYRNVSQDAIYDFSRPPPKVAATRLRFDAESVAQRLGRTAPREAADASAS